MDKFFPGLGQDAISATEYAMYGHQLGVVKMDSYGNKYKFCKVTNVNDYAATGKPVGIRAAGTSESDLSDDVAASSVAMPAGVTASKFSGTDKVYGWVMIEGDLETALDGAGMTITTTGSVAQGDFLTWSADGVLTTAALTAAGGTDLVVIGRAAKADATNDLTAGRIFQPSPAIGG